MDYSDNEIILTQMPESVQMFAHKQIKIFNLISFVVIHTITLQVILITLALFQKKGEGYIVKRNALYFYFRSIYQTICADT